jgi:heterodisulfide reductase subunit C/coenzyme F420-reducing hydrogenase delta subunit
LYTCSSCGTCTATCLIRRLDPAFNPRLTILKATLGLREEVLGAREIWECSACDMCYARCPREIHISAIMKAIRTIALRDGYSRPGATATVKTATCVACGHCVAACPYHAAALKRVAVGRRVKTLAQVDANLCAGCGICSAVCPSSSIQVEGHTDRQLYDSLLAKARVLDQVAASNLRSKVLVVLCNWCLHSALDARVALEPPSGVQIVQVPCAGRVSPLLVLTALDRGADAVLTVGCKDGECHYIQGNKLEASRATLLGQFLDMLGVGRERVRFERLGALDRGQFSRLLATTGRRIALPVPDLVHKER